MSDDPAGQVPANEASAVPSGLEALTEDVVPALIARLRASRLGELEVRSGSWRVRLRRDPAATARAAIARTGAEDDAAAESATSVARSPAVGYFSPAPQLLVGAAVQAGDVLGLIDVLGIEQEVVAATEGIIASVLAEDGQAVEYGQALAEIDPLDVGFGVDDDDGETA